MSGDTTKTVLVVEDHEINSRLFHDLLDAHGYHVFQTKNGMEALNIAREYKPDLVLLDIQQSSKISGLEIARQFNEDMTLQSIPLVVIAASAVKGEEAIKQAHCSAYLSSPISVMGFMDIVRRFISS